ncbi:hypothetical protein [Jiella marina]|uniref:hypothetical protein n=1 Tax=Jiella sp. LLJ827 TaxID=2917712 RepID=UPI002101BAE4|nr:hypothetical protein [Jiella sp. LLJ827]MCQ0989613.1 hypothetical protein [Jiella sp. LLJ827]
MKAFGGQMAALLSDRLFTFLEKEIAHLELQQVGDFHPIEGVSRPKAGLKERADALILLTRALEKLLELRRQEGETDEGSEAETLRLRDELLVRLKQLDARRKERGGLFGGNTADGKAPARRRSRTAPTAGRTRRG